MARTTFPAYGEKTNPSCFPDRELPYHTILYCTILYYTVLYCTIITVLYYTYYTILYYTMLCCTILYYTELNYTMLYCTLLYYRVTYCAILYYPVLYWTILHCTGLYSTIVTYTVLYCTILHYSDLYNAILHPQHTTLYHIPRRGTTLLQGELPVWTGNPIPPFLNGLRTEYATLIHPSPETWWDSLPGARAPLSIIASYSCDPPGRERSISSCSCESTHCRTFFL